MHYSQTAYSCVVLHFILFITAPHQAHSLYTFSITIRDVHAIISTPTYSFRATSLQTSPSPSITLDIASINHQGVQDSC
jgi:hypothetical protein